jgi:hypothetical protein
MLCEERDRLLSIHLAAVAKNAEAAPAIAKLKGEGWSEAWWEAKKEARRILQETLADLNRHRAGHGC